MDASDILKRFDSVEAESQQLFSVCGEFKNRMIELEVQVEKLTAQLMAINEEEKIQAQKNDVIRKRIDILLKRLEDIEKNSSGNREDEGLLPIENKGELW